MSRDREECSHISNLKILTSGEQRGYIIFKRPRLWSPLGLDSLLHTGIPSSFILPGKETQVHFTQSSHSDSKVHPHAGKKFPFLIHPSHYLFTDVAKIATCLFFEPLLKPIKEK